MFTCVSDKNACLYCIIGAGSEPIDLHFVVGKAPAVLEDLEDLVKTAPDKAVFECKVDRGDPEAEITWFRKDRQVQELIWLKFLLWGTRSDPHRILPLKGCPQVILFAAGVPERKVRDLIQGTNCLVDHQRPGDWRCRQIQMRSCEQNQPRRDGGKTHRLL